MTERKLKIFERLSMMELQLELKKQQLEWEDLERRLDYIPREWHHMEKTAPCTTPKHKLTLSLDKDVVKFYRGLGRGYQARMNSILRSYMHARIAKIIEGHGDRDAEGELI
ncbi:BrnA antitoxin family protein [Rhodobacteraceae bacterium NNCM2]|nr:BrnA antitoxin family protein [Coraliihabitans acroporae]